MAISQPPFQSILVDADDRVQTPWAQWFSQLQPILQSVVASGPTSGRPTQTLFIGYPYFDTTIDQMVYWNGVIWVTYAPSTTGTSILKGNGTGGFNNAIAGIDFAPATSGSAILYGNGAGGFSSVAIGSGVTFASGVLSASGSGGTVTSVSGTGSVNGITLTGTVTSSGSLTLGGTLGGIGNSQLTNSSITINGSSVSLGGSTTVTATATNALTIGTGLSGTSYDGSTAVTIANAGVLSITGTANQVIASASTGAVTLSLPQSINSGAAPTFLGTNFTGTASININGTVGATTATTGKFTTLEYTSTLTGGTGIVAIGTSQIYKAVSGNVGIGVIPAVKLDVGSPNTNSIIRVGDYTANATSAYPLIEAFGCRQDANSTFFGRFGASKRRSDGTDIPSGQVVGVYAFGGQWGTDTSYQSAKHLYAASIMGISESSFTSATTMSTGIIFNTGSAGAVLSAFNTGYGTERMRITSTGGVNIGASTDPGLGNLKIVGAIIVGAVTATSAAAPTIASATTIAPTKAITFISGVTPIVTITPPSPISLGGGTITLIPTGIFTTTIAGNIALASTAVVGRALTMTYDVTTTKWYPSY